MMTFVKFFAGALLVANTTANAMPSSQVEGKLGLGGNVALMSLTLDTDTSNVRLYTDSWAAGKYFNGELALWDASGKLLANNDDYAKSFPIAGAMTFRDAGILTDLKAGTYTVGLMHWTNAPFTDQLADGFKPSPNYNLYAFGEADFWRVNTTVGYFGMPVFTEMNMEATVRNISPVPEADGFSMLLVGLGLTGALGYRRRRGEARTWNA